MRNDTPSLEEVQETGEKRWADSTGEHALNVRMRLQVVINATSSDFGISLIDTQRLTGAELVQSVESLGYAYDTKEGTYVSDKGNQLCALDANLKLLDTKALKKLEKGGGDAKIAYIRIAYGYKNVRDAFTGLNKCSTDDVVVREDTQVYAVVHGPSMKEYLVIVGPKDDTYVLTMYTNKGVAAGLVDKVNSLDGTESEKLGNSIDEVWKSLTGGSVGDYVREHPFK